MLHQLVWHGRSGRAGRLLLGRVRVRPARVDGQEHVRAHQGTARREFGGYFCFFIVALNTEAAIAACCFSYSSACSQNLDQFLAACHLNTK